MKYPLIETRLATLERISPDLLEVRFKPDQKIDVAGIAEILTEREHLCASGPYAVLATLPPDVDFDINVMTTDHYRGRQLNSCTRALAFAANSVVNEHMANIFYAYFPQGFKTQIFGSEEDARNWLVGQLAERSLS